MGGKPSRKQKASIVAEPSFLKNHSRERYAEQKKNISFCKTLREVSNSTTWKSTGGPPRNPKLSGWNTEGRTRKNMDQDYDDVTWRKKDDNDMQRYDTVDLRSNVWYSLLMQLGGVYVLDGSVRDEVRGCERRE